MPVARRAILTIALASAGACSRAIRAPRGFNLSSDGSDYSPTVSLALDVTNLLVRRDSIIVAVDSGRIAAPGGGALASSAVMTDLYMTAVVAMTNTDALSEARVKAPWIPLAESDSVLVASSLALGAEAPLRALRFAIARPASLDGRKAWLAFRISGSTVTSPVRLADGRVAEPARQSSIRVFACADWTLDGFVDNPRARLLARSYQAGC